MDTLKLNNLMSEVARRKKIIDKRFGVWLPTIICFVIAFSLGTVFSIFIPNTMIQKIFLVVFSFTLFCILFFKQTYDLARKKEEK